MESYICNEIVHLGVMLRTNGRWVTQIKLNGQGKRLGAFDTEEAAARAYDERARKGFVNPILNFLPDGSLNPYRKKLDSKSVK